MLFFRVCNYAAKLRIKSKTTKNNVISPAGASLQLVPNSEFTILSPSYLSHSSYLSHLSHPFSQFKIQNSKFSPCPTIAPTYPAPCIRWLWLALSPASPVPQSPVQLAPQSSQLSQPSQPSQSSQKKLTLFIKYLPIIP